MNVIPLPNFFEKRPNTFTFTYNLPIYFSNEFTQTKEHFTNYFSKKSNITLSDSTSSKVIFLLNLDLHEEGYIIDVTEKSIIAEARTDKGAFYALQTIKQLIYTNNNLYTIDCILIKDEPRFTYRSFMLDVARHFFPKETIFKLIDLLSFHKFNYFHLHLSDDQGFRFKIEKYPLLTKIGSTRKRTKLLGGGYDNTPHSGFYTKEDMIEIINYAKRNFIEIIPEIDFPGHTTAILASYPELACINQNYKVAENFGIKKTSLCITKDNTYDFVYSLLDELIAIFPSKFIHIGGDELRIANYKKCEGCKKLLKESKSKAKFANYFINKIASYLREKGKIPIAWNDYINYNTNYNVISQHWKPFTKNKTIKEINEGRKTIISNFFYFYLDYPYSMTPLHKTYNFEPVFSKVISPDNIIGIESPLWTEYVPNDSILEYQVLPRLAAVSEVAWTNRELKNYNDFTKRLKHINEIYSKNYLNFHQNATKSYSLITRLIKTINWFRGK